MRAAIVFCLMLCACGDWSNEDLEYLYALPQKDLLKSKLGETGVAGQGLRRDPLLGEHSDVYDGAKNASDRFNGFLDEVLTGLDTLRMIHPTTRQSNKRIWGPWPDDKHAGFDNKIEIEKTADKSYRWSIQGRRRGSPDFVTFVGGRFIATESLRKGIGEFFYDAVAADALYGTMKKAEEPDRVDFGYATNMEPVIVEIRVKVPSLVVPVSMDLNRYTDGAGVLGYTLEGLKDPNATKISALAAYDAKGAGQVVYSILAGNYAPAAAQQCWDENQKVVYETGNWPDAGTAGNVRDCAEVKGLINLPPFP